MECLPLNEFKEQFCAKYERYEHKCQSLHQKLDHEGTKLTLDSYTQCWIEDIGYGT